MKNLKCQFVLRYTTLFDISKFLIREKDSFIPGAFILFKEVCGRYKQILSINNVILS